MRTLTFEQAMEQLRKELPPRAQTEEDGTRVLFLAIKEIQRLRASSDRYREQYFNLYNRLDVVRDAVEDLIGHE